MKKKLVSILLVFSMLLGISPVFRIPAIAAAAAGAEKVGLSELDNATLKNLGFSTDAESLKEQAASSISPYGNGITTIVAQHELLITQGKDYRTVAYDVKLGKSSGSVSTAKTYRASAAGYDAYRTLSFDATGSGKSNWVATLGMLFRDGRAGISLLIDAPSGKTKVDVVATLPFEVHPENAGAWMSMAAGNFDGSEDGSQELAVYHPFGGKNNRGTIEFYSYSLKSNGEPEIKNIKSFDLSSAAANHFPNNSNNAYSKKKDEWGDEWKFMYLAPALSMDTVTQTGDAADDLAVAFSVAIDGGKADKIAGYTSIPKRTPRDAATGVFFLIDAATKNAKTTKSVYMHNTWKEYGVTSKQDKDYAKKYEIMHFGGVGAGDVNGDGLQEVVVAGYAYEQRDGADSDKSWNLSQNEYLATYFTYDPAKKTYNRVDQPMSWVSLKKDDYFGATNLGDGIFSDYGSKDVVHTPLQVECFAEQGAGEPESVAIGGIVTRLDPYGTGTSDHTPDIKKFVGLSFDYGAFNPIYAIPTEYFHDNTITYTVQNRLFTQMVAGNFDGNLAGQEQLAFAYLTKEKDSDDYSSVYGIISQNGSGTDDVCNVEKKENNRYLGAGLRLWWDTAHHNKGSEDRQAAMGLAIVDCDDDSVLMRRSDLPNEYYFSNPYIVAVMQASPYFADLIPYLADTGETSITKTTGSGKEEEHGVSVGLTVQLGYEWEFANSGAGFKVGISGEFENTWGESSMTTYSVTFTATDENMVALIMTPHVRYHYDIFDPETKTWSPITVDAPQNPRTSIITVAAYDKVAEEQGWETISKVLDGEEARDKVLSNIPGDPASYAQSAAGLEGFLGAVNTTKSEEVDGKEVFYTKSDFLLVGAGSSASAGQSINVENTSSVNRSWSVVEQADVGIKKGGFTVDISQHLGYTGASSKIDLTGYTYNSEVINIPTGFENDYSFEWRFGTWNETLKTKEGREELEFPVLGYLVREVKQPEKSPIEATNEYLHVKTPGTHALELSWQEAQNAGLGPIQGDGYMLYRYFHGVYYPIANLSRNEMKDGWYSFTDVNVDPYSEYLYAVRPYEIENEYLSFGNYSALTTAYTIADVENMPRATLRLNKSTNTLSVALTSATGGNLGNLDYRWQKYIPEQGGWQDIPGAIGMEYNIGDEDVSLFRCRVAQRVGTKIYIIYSNTILENMYVFVAGKTREYTVDGKTYVDYVLVNENGSVEVVSSTNLKYNTKHVYSRSTDANGELVLEFDEYTRQRRYITEVSGNTLVINDNISSEGGETLTLASYSTVWDPSKLVSAVSNNPAPMLQEKMQAEIDKQEAQASFLAKMDNIASTADMISLLKNEPIGYSVIGDTTTATMTSGNTVLDGADEIVNLYFGSDTVNVTTVAADAKKPLDPNNLPAIQKKEPKENTQISYAVNEDGSLRAAFILQENVHWSAPSYDFGGWTLPVTNVDVTIVDDTDAGIEGAAINGVRWRYYADDGDTVISNLSHSYSAGTTITIVLPENGTVSVSGGIIATREIKEDGAHWTFIVDQSVTVTIGVNYGE